jgi:PhoPQ-activated pathogenicity-related protein
MTKSAVRAMDAVIDFATTDAMGDVDLSGFVVAGASKRGWTTWTTAIVDSRVVAIVPIVIDLLNVEPSFAHHWRVYGAWSPAIQDYVEMGIPAWFGSKEFRGLLDIVDPYSYRERLVLPKLIINATGDPFFTPDSSSFYFDDLPGESYLRYVPNTDHFLRDTDTWDSLLAFYRTVLDGSERPEVTWRAVGGGTLEVETDLVPHRVRMWQATNPEARDFRLDTIGPSWTDSELHPRADGTYVARVPSPERGWTAFFVELSFESEGSREPLKLTTGVRVVPDLLPFSPFEAPSER